MFKGLVALGEIVAGYEKLQEQVVKPLSDLNADDVKLLLGKFKVIVNAGEDLTLDKVNAKGSCLTIKRIPIAQSKPCTTLVGT